MNFKFLTAIVSIGMMVGCSNFEGKKRSISSVDNIPCGLTGRVQVENSMNQSEVQKICKNELKEMAGIKASWRLPSAEKYKQANRDSCLMLGRSLLNMSYWFWTASFNTMLEFGTEYNSLIFSGFDGYVDIDSRSSSEASVRCVASEK